MDQAALQKLVTCYVRDAQAMEENVLMVLDSLMATTKDTQILLVLGKHKAETEIHERRLSRRLRAMLPPVSTPRDIPGLFGLLATGMIDSARGDKTLRNARDAYVTESLEIAAYRLLEELAIRAGDQETAGIARDNCRDELAMRDVIDASWAHCLQLTLQEKGLAEITPG